MDYELDIFNSTSYYDDSYAEGDNRTGLNTRVWVGVGSLLTLISLICNGLVVAVVAKRSLLQNFPYIIIACLACIDICMSFWNIWYIFMATEVFHFPPIFCQVIFFIPIFLPFLKTLCYCTLALVLWRVKGSLQFGEKKDVKKSGLVILLLCLLSVILSYPVGHFVDFFGMTACVIGTLEMSYVYSKIVSVFTYVVCTIVVITSLAIAKRNRVKEVVDVDEEGHVMEKKEQLDKRFEIMFMIMWVLFMVTRLVHEMFIRFFYTRGFEFVWFAVAYILAIYKLFLYMGMDKNFKKEFHALFAKTSNI